jgi:FkbM family methyltransferase
MSFDSKVYDFIRPCIVVVKRIFKKFGIGITSYAVLADLQEKSLGRSAQDLEFIRSVSDINDESLVHLLQKSKSQLRQDLFVLSQTNFKKHGYYVEFGATNGIDLSNSYILESSYSWQGILAEPAAVWHEALRKNRPNSHIENLCIWKDSDTTLTFNETAAPQLSTVDLFSEVDSFSQSRLSGKKYLVKTISLRDLLVKYKAPKYIDYLSIDTEGSEYEILRAFNFSEYSFGVITVEHNYTSQREQIFELLSSEGYERRFTQLSDFDDWYVKIS